MKSGQSSYKRRIIGKIILAAVLWIFAISKIIMTAHGGEARETLVTAFNQVQLMDMNAQVESFGYFGNVYMSMEARKQMVKDIGYKLGMSNCQVDQEWDGSLLVTSIHRDGVNAETDIKLITKEEKLTDTIIDSHQYISININLRENVESALYYKQVIKEIMEKYDVVTDVTVNLTGYIDGYADIAIKDMVADRMIELMNGKVVAENRTENLYTIYAYTKNVNDSITLGGKKINLNISSYYDEADDRTYFYVATPVINADY